MIMLVVATHEHCVFTPVYCYITVLLISSWRKELLCKYGSTDGDDFSFKKNFARIPSNNAKFYSTCLISVFEHLYLIFKFKELGKTVLVYYLHFFCLPWFYLLQQSNYLEFPS